MPLALGVPEEIKSEQPVLGCKVKVMKNKIIIALLGFQEFLWGVGNVCPLLTNKNINAPRILLKKRNSRICPKENSASGTIASSSPRAASLNLD